MAGLKACRLLHGLDENIIAALAEGATIQKHPAAANLLLPGDKLSAIYVVLKGWVMVYRLNEQGEETVTCLFGPTDALLGDLLFYNHPSPVGAQTETEAEVIYLPVDTIRRAMNSHAQLGANLMQSMADLTHDLMYLVEQVTVQPAVERIAGFLLRAMLDKNGHLQKEFELPFEKTKIAHYLGLTPETFSRSLKVLAQRGVVVKGDKVQLVDVKGLCANCDPVLAHKCENAKIPGYCRMFNT
jgi:CRP/FNR family transcriptional activator FtrB